MKAFDTLQQKTDSWIEQINDYLSRLSTRERIMVVAGTIIVVISLLTYSLWKMNTVANDQQKRLNELKDTLVWMQTNVVTMKPAGDLGLTATEKVQRVAQQQGISVAAQEVGEQIQIVAQHQNYSILANFLTQIAQMGLSIEKLELNKSGEQIKLTATVQ